MRFLLHYAIECTSAINEYPENTRLILRIRARIFMGAMQKASYMIIARSGNSSDQILSMVFFD